MKFNRIDPEGASDFANFNTTAISVDLSFNPIGPDGAKDFALLNTRASTVNLSNCLLGNEGAKYFAQFNTTVTDVNLSQNRIYDEGAKALASNTVLQHICMESNNVSTSGYAALSETDPIKRARYGREVGLATEIPSLLRISLFAVKEKITTANGDQVRVITSNDLNEAEDLVPVINQNRF